MLWNNSNYSAWTIDCGNISRWSCVSRTCKIGILIIFPFLQIPATSLIKPTNNGPVLNYLWKLKTIYTWWCSRKSLSLTFGFNLTLTSTFPYSIIILECRQLLCSYHLTPVVMLPLKENLTMHLVAITQLKQWLINGKNCERKLH